MRLETQHPSMYQLELGVNGRGQGKAHAQTPHPLEVPVEDIKHFSVEEIKHISLQKA